MACYVMQFLVHEYCVGGQAVLMRCVWNNCCLLTIPESIRLVSFLSSCHTVWSTQYNSYVSILSMLLLKGTVPFAMYPLNYDKISVVPFAITGICNGYFHCKLLCTLELSLCYLNLYPSPVHLQNSSENTDVNVNVDFEL